MANPVLQRLVDERQRTNENIDKVLDAANDEEREPSESERELLGRMRANLERLEPQIGEMLELEETRTQARDARGALNRRRETPAENEDEDEGEPAAELRDLRAVRPRRADLPLLADRRPGRSRHPAPGEGANDPCR